MPAEKTRQTLISKITDQQDESAWTEFVSYYEDYLKVILGRYKLSEAEIHDSLQNTLVKIWQELPNFEYNPNKGRFRSWIAQIAINDVRNSVRKEVRLKEAQGQSLDFEESPEDFELKLEKEWKVFISKKAWENISPDLTEAMRETFDLYLKGLNSREISEKLHITEAVARVYKQRISYKLKYEIKRLDRELS